MASIEIRYKGVALDQDSHNIETESCNKADFVFDVVVDGSPTLPNYNVIYDGPSLILKRVGNNVYVTIPDNVSSKGKEFKIYFSHNMFPSKNYTVYISQPGKVYEILMRSPHTISEPADSLVFNAQNLFGKTDPNSESWRIHMTCDEGYNDFGVEEIEEYISDTGTRIPYDGGLSVVKTGNNMLTITNYGRISMHDNVDYVIKVYHKNDRNAKKTITIRYNTDTDSGFDFGE